MTTSGFPDHFFSQSDDGLELFLAVPAKYNRFAWFLIGSYIRALYWATAWRLRGRSVPELARQLCASPLRITWRQHWFPMVIRRIDEVLKILGKEDHQRCLIRSLMMCRLLRRMDFEPRLNMGLAEDQREMGHAWVTLADRPVCDNLHSGFSALLHDDGDIRYWLPDVVATDG